MKISKNPIGNRTLIAYNRFKPKRYNVKFNALFRASGRSAPISAYQPYFTETGKNRLNTARTAAVYDTAGKSDTGGKGISFLNIKRRITRGRTERKDFDYPPDA
ncbi:MAG: hypothetical protein NC312_13070, partial [Bacteroides fragilis]|nr:hypothetical protein [Bacteroides fragilis]